jgi:hypothetical protein
MRGVLIRRLGIVLFVAGLWFSLATAATAKEAALQEGARVQTVQYYYGPGYYGRPRYYGPHGYYGPRRYWGPYGYRPGPRFYGRPGYYRRHGYGYRY